MHAKVLAIVATMTLLACGSDDADAPAAAGAGGAGGAAAGASGGAGAAQGGAGAGGEQAGGSAGSAAGSAGAPGAPPKEKGEFDPAPFGGDRPVKLYVPKGYVEGEARPLVILLHGYGASGSLQELLFNLKKSADERGFLYMHPDGTLDPSGKRYWNATDVCCGFGASEVDDVGYISGLIDEVKGRYKVDEKRVFLAGHSNGAFMAYSMACAASGKIAAIAGLAGATFDDDSKCQPTEPVSVLHVHGTKDDTIAYEGGKIFNNQYPSARKSVELWAAHDGCGAAPEAGGSLDIEASIEGEESDVERYGGCASGSSVELWTVKGAGHIPNVSSNFRVGVADFLLAHPKP